MSGLAVARRLAADGGALADVIEVGRRSAADHMNMIHSVAEIEDMWRIPRADPALWRPWDSSLPPHYSGATGLRSHLGGRSLYWHGVVLRLDPWALDTPGTWPDNLVGPQPGRPGLYDPVEDELAAWSGRPLQAPRSDGEESLLAWVRSLGYENAERAPLAVQRLDTADGPRWRAYSPLYADASPAPRGLTQPRISVGERALAVSLARGRPAVLLQDRGTRRVRREEADAVVLAAGTIENTRLLAQLMAERGVEQHRYAGLNDHIVQGFAVFVPRSPWGRRGADGACLMAGGDEKSRSNLFIKLHDGPDPSGVIFSAWEMGEQEPSDVNAVGFPERGALPWRPVVDVGLTGNDENVVAGQRDRLQAVWDAVARALGLPRARLSFGDFLVVPRDIAGYLPKAVASPGTPVEFVSTLGSVDHEAGTVPYGGWLGPSGQVTGAPAVFIVGPAAFPRSGAANPSLTILALARHVADHVASFLGVQPRAAR
jgi:choline dehydrogenase-like flavoprotein